MPIKVWPDLPNITVDETKDWAYQVEVSQFVIVYNLFDCRTIATYVILISLDNKVLCAYRIVCC